MHIDIVGSSSKTSNDLLIKAAEFYGQYLLGKRLYKNIDLTIELKRFKKSSDEYAFCDYELDNNRPRDFIITINEKLNQRETLLALAHEMVHLKQYAKGEMKDIFRPSRMVRWKTERYHTEEVDYWETPWEIEAYGREKGLYVKFMTHLKENEDALC